MTLLAIYPTWRIVSGVRRQCNFRFRLWPPTGPSLPSLDWFIGYLITWDDVRKVKTLTWTFRCPTFICVQCVFRPHVRLWTLVLFLETSSVNIYEFITRWTRTTVILHFSYIIHPLDKYQSRHVWGPHLLFRVNLYSSHRIRLSFMGVTDWSFCVSQYYGYGRPPTVTVIVFGRVWTTIKDSSLPVFVGCSKVRPDFTTDLLRFTKSGPTGKGDEWKRLLRSTVVRRHVWNGTEIKDVIFDFLSGQVTLDRDQ